MRHAAKHNYHSQTRKNTENNPFFSLFSIADNNQSVHSMFASRYRVQNTGHSMGYDEQGSGDTTFTKVSITPSHHVHVPASVAYK